jgi:hypothetical protein
VKRLLLLLVSALMLGTACVQVVAPAPAPAPAAPAPTPAAPAPAATKVLSPEEVAASYNLPYVSLFTIEPTITMMGWAVTLKWDVKNSSDIVIEPNLGIVQPAGSKEFTAPFATTTYKLTATNAQGSIISTTMLTIAGDMPGRDTPRVTQFMASPHIIKKGDSATLAWTTRAASAVTLDGKTIPADGSTLVSPTETTTYNLIATSQDGTQYQSCTVNVR